MNLKDRQKMYRDRTFSYIAEQHKLAKTILKHVANQYPSLSHRLSPLPRSQP